MFHSEIALRNIDVLSRHNIVTLRTAGVLGKRSEKLAAIGLETPLFIKLVSDWVAEKLVIGGEH